MRKQIFVAVSLTLLVLAANGQPASQDASKPPGSNSQPGGSATQPQAQAGQRSPREPGERVFGTIASVGVDRLDVKKMDGTTQTVMVGDQTRYVEGGRETQKTLGLEDLKPADRVFIQGKTNENKELVASLVRRITDQDVQRFAGQRAGGEIISIEANQIKVRNPWQGERTIVVNEQTAFTKDGQPIALKDLKVGDRIFALGQESNGHFVAARIMTGQFRRGAGRGGDGRTVAPDNQQ